MGDLSRNFSRYEFKCDCNKCECDTVDVELLEVLQATADYFDAAVTITSGHRCVDWNKSIGGADKSFHLYGRAADIVVDQVHPSTVQDYLLRVYDGQYGIGKYKNFTHLDTRTNSARW
tara:strand:+ start:93 stop:446 length:354 start_codon:yes stop_codon:yes gene_type:complete